MSFRLCRAGQSMSRGFFVFLKLAFSAVCIWEGCWVYFVVSIKIMSCDVSYTVLGSKSLTFSPMNFIHLFLNDYRADRVLKFLGGFIESQQYCLKISTIAANTASVLGLNSLPDLLLLLLYQLYRGLQVGHIHMGPQVTLLLDFTPNCIVQEG